MKKYIISIALLCVFSPILLSAKKQKTLLRSIKETIHNMWDHNGIQRKYDRITKKIKANPHEKILLEKQNQAWKEKLKRDTSWGRHISLQNAVIAIVAVYGGGNQLKNYIVNKKITSKIT